MAKKETVKKEIVKKDELREEKMKALENALTQLNKTYGKGSVMKFSDKVADTNLPVSYTHLDVYKRQDLLGLTDPGDFQFALVTDFPMFESKKDCLLYTSRCV